MRLEDANEIVSGSLLNGIPVAPIMGAPAADVSARECADSDSPNGSVEGARNRRSMPTDRALDIDHRTGVDPWQQPHRSE